MDDPVMNTGNSSASQSRSGKSNRFVIALIALVAVAGFCWIFPPLHIRSLAQTRAAKASTLFNATDFAGKFWNERLLKSLPQAADAGRVLAAIAAGPQKAHEHFGRSVGISSSYYFFLRGAGRVVSVDDTGVGLSLKGESNEVEVFVPLGLVFGNAVRDGTGLLDSSAFPNSQEFNDISAGLNHIVEAQVLPELKHIAAVGKRVQFAGCVEVADEDTDLKPLKLVPISVKLE
jgi:predicted lipoprotein